MAKLTPAAFMADLRCERFTYTQAKRGPSAGQVCKTCHRFLRLGSPCPIGIAAGRAALASSTMPDERSTQPITRDAGGENAA